MVEVAADAASRQGPTDLESEPPDALGDAGDRGEPAADGDRLRRVRTNEEGENVFAGDEVLDERGAGRQGRPHLRQADRWRVQPGRGLGSGEAGLDGVQLVFEVAD